VLIGFATIVYADDPNDVRRLQAKKDPPLANTETKHARPILQGLHVAMACDGVTDKGCVDPRLDETVKPFKVAQGGKRCAGSQPELLAHFLQGQIGARLSQGAIEFCCRFRVDDLLIGQLRKKRNSCWHF
jgi:hypothetical protein